MTPIIQSKRLLNVTGNVVGVNDYHLLYELLDTLGTPLRAYESENVSMPLVSEVEVLHYLIEERGLGQADLPELGSQGVVSEILNGKRELNVRQIKALAGRFGVSPAVFF